MTSTGTSPDGEADMRATARSRGPHPGGAPAQRAGRLFPTWSLRRLVTPFVAAVIAAGCAAPTPGPPARPSPSPLVVIRRTLHEHATENDVGLVALVETDGRVWRLADGLDARDRPVDPRARFDMGSTGKTYEAVVALQLVEEGRLSLDDSIEEWIPDRVEGAQDVLIRHLLNHTSTLEGERAPWHPTGIPGTEFSYSNLGYGLLWEIIEEVTGRPLDREIRDRIIQPLGLEESWFSSEGSGLPWLGAPYGTCRICLPPGSEGGPSSTTSDIARFFQALLRGELLGEEMLAEMTTETFPMGTEMSAGHCLFRFDLPCGVAYGHGGDLTYYSNQVLVSGDGSKVVVLARGRGDWFTTKKLAEEIYCQAP